MADNLANDDKSNPAAAAEINNLLNRYPPPGGVAPAIATPTTQSAKPGTGPMAAIKPGKRTQNPLSNFSSYTYQISLYMVTPDAYDAFILSGRTNINAISNMASGAAQTPAGSAYLIAQSGGINNTTSKRAPGFELDYYIDDLKITQTISGKDVQGPSNVSDFTFTITEPYGFSLLTKLRKAQTELATNTNVKNFALAQNPARQMFILGIRFLGYDKNGKVINSKDVPSSDGNPQGNASGLFERYYDILIRDLKFKIDGKSVVYNIVAKNAGTVIGFGGKLGTVYQDTPIVGQTVYDALLGGNTVAASVKPGETATPQGFAPGVTGLLAKLNYDQQQLVGKGIEIARVYDVVFLGDKGDVIRNASLISKADLDKRKLPTTSAANTTEVNIKTEQINNEANNTVRKINIAQGTPILQAVNDIIKQSSYMEDALTAIDQSNLSPDPVTKSYETQSNTKPKELSWFSIHAEIKNLGWDNLQGDFVYKTTYIIQPYLTPVVIAAAAKISNTTPYYGAHKRYEYWFTGQNSEVIRYEQQMDFTYYNVTLGGLGVDSNAQGGGADVPVSVGQPQGQPDQGKLNAGLEAQNSYMNSLFSPRDFGNVKLSILGDPDFLMQSSPSSINALYNQFYGTDGFTINPNGGQVFIEINFKEPIDYQNSKGLLSMNQSIYFYKYPDTIQKELDSRGGGVSLMVKTVISTFSKGKFQQELNCSLNTFGDPGTGTAADAGRPSEPQATAPSARAGNSPATNSTGTGTSTVSTQPGTMGAYVSRAPALATAIPTTPAAPISNTITVPTNTGKIVQDDDAGVSAGAAMLAASKRPKVSWDPAARAETTGGTSRTRSGGL